MSSPSGNYYFYIINRFDSLVYEAELSKTYPTSIAASGDSNSKKKEDSYFYEFIAHASLDFLDERLASKSQQNLFYSNIDRFNEWLISAFVTPSHLRFIVLHDQRNEENIKAFCQEVHEVYVKYLLNPFNKHNEPIRSENFQKKVKSIAKKYLGIPM